VRQAELRGLLQRVRRGTVSPREAARRLDGVPLERLEFATLDHQRTLRVGFPEVVFGLGKTPAQMVAIARRLLARHGVVLLTRVEPPAREALARGDPPACCAPTRHRARAGAVRRHRRSAGRRGSVGDGAHHG
jgi:NCAIR mutase (PurE)-related protein